MKSIEELTEAIERREKYYTDYSLDVGLSIKLTQNLHEHYKDSRDFLFMVMNDNGVSHQNGHATMCADSYSDMGCIDVPCTPFAKLMLEIFENKELSDFLPGVEVTMQHEIGHDKDLQYAGNRVFSEHTGHSYNSETVAELYALSKMGDSDQAIDAEARFVAMCAYIFNPLSIENMVKEHMKYYADNSESYSFPLRGSAVKEISRRAEIYTEKLYKVIGDRLRPKPGGVLERALQI